MRLRRRSDFRRVLRSGRRVTVPEFVLYHAPRSDSGPPRVGFAVPRRVGKAVVRNRIRRLLRVAAGRVAPRLVSCDVVVAVRPGIAALGLEELEAGLGEAVARAGLIRTGPRTGWDPVKGTSA
jgi:ribonuclease P protein component